jgi:hypothetical protein
MTDSLSKSLEITETTILTDVEAEHEKREQTTNLFPEKTIFIPDHYRAQMAKTGLLDRLITLIQNESIRNKEIKEMLHKHNINIPPEFYSQMMESNL